MFLAKNNHIVLLRFCFGITESYFEALMAFFPLEHTFALDLVHQAISISKFRLIVDKYLNTYFRWFSSNQNYFPHLFTKFSCLSCRFFFRPAIISS
jgi:hypothetical protein